MLTIGLTGNIACGKSFIARLFAVYGVRIIDSDIIAREIVLPNTPTLTQLAEAFGKEIINANGSINRSYLRQLVFSQPDKLELLNNITHPAINKRTQELCKLCAAGLPFPATYQQIYEQQQHAMQANVTPSKFDSDQGFLIINDSNSMQAQIALHEPLDPEAVFTPKQRAHPPYIMVDIPLLFENHLEKQFDRILVVEASKEAQLQRIMQRDHCSEELARIIMNKQLSPDFKHEHADDIINTDRSNIAEKRQHVLNLHRLYCQLATSSDASLLKKF